MSSNITQLRAEGSSLTLAMLKELSRAELIRLHELIVLEIKIRDRENVSQFRPGDRVMFFSKRNGRMIHGQFIKQMNKNAQILSDEKVNWRVSPGLVRKEV